MTTAFGSVRLAREYTTGPDGGAFAADAALGIDGPLTLQARRVVALAGVRQSFAKARQLVLELCGWTVGQEAVRGVTHAEARRAAADRPGRGDAARFAACPEAIEVPIDAGKVNTLDGWRDVKLAAFSRRKAGEAATPEAWDDRDLPPPTARAVVAAVEGCGPFAERVRREADRLGVTTAVDVTVLADGAEWIWNLAEAVVPQAAGVLDVYHAVEAVAGAVKAVWGEGTVAAAGHTDAGRRALLAGGKSGVEAWLGSAFASVPAGVSTGPLLGLAGYLGKHPTRLDYAGRLASGRSIGSGQIEGAVKQLVNQRFKKTGARWAVANVGPLVELVALCDTPDWRDLWVAA